MTQVNETTNEGLKRELQVIVPKDELGTRFDERLNEIKGQIQLKGFRKGKVPVAHLKKVYGQSLMAEILQKAVEESSTSALQERKERPALQPKIDLPEDEAEIKAIMDGKADLPFTMSYEVLPEIAITDFSKISLEKMVAEVDEEAVDKALDELAGRASNYEADESAVAENDDRLKINFVGKIDGEAFEGGTGEDTHIVLGAGTFIPGFEEQLVGAKKGDERLVKVTFPENYQASHLAGKDAEFDVTVTEVAKPVKPEVNDELAKTMGAENLAKLREMVEAQISNEYAQISRSKLKQELLDALEEAHSFELPPSLVKSEFDAIWKQVTQSMEEAKKTFEDEGKTEESAREEYQKIAERRVRLGLVIGEIGEKNNISVSKEELQRAILEQTRRYPGQEKFVYEYYEKNPGALSELRAPIFEDKVIDLVLELSKVEDKKVSIDELVKAMEEDDEGEAGDDGDAA